MKTTVTLLILLVLTVPALAAEDGALSLNPAVVMLSGDFGQSTTQTFTLRNGTSRPFSFDLVAQDVVTNDGRRTFVDAGSIAGSIAATAVFSERHIEIPPGGSVSVDVTVTLPPATTQRAIVAMFRGTNRVMSGDVPMKASLGALLTFSLSDRVEMSAEPLQILPQNAAASLTVAQSCTNSGSEPLVAKGVFAVVDSRGALVGKAPLETRRLLPGETTRIAGEYGGDLEAGRYRVLVTYDYEGRSLTQSAEIDIP